MKPEKEKNGTDEQLSGSPKRKRSKEEIEERRAARRKLYEEMEAFENDLPDFLKEELAQMEAKQQKRRAARQEHRKKGLQKKEPQKKELRRKESGKKEDVQEELWTEAIQEERLQAEELQREELQENRPQGQEAQKEEEDRNGGQITEVSGQEGGGKKSSRQGSGRRMMKKRASAGADGQEGQTDANQVLSALQEEAGKPSAPRRRRVRRERLNIRLYVLCASATAAVMLGGFFSLRALGIIGGYELYEVYVNEQLVGKVYTEQEGREVYQEVRREIVSASDEMVLMSADCDIRKVESLIKQPTDAEELRTNMTEALQSNIMGTLNKAYTVKIGDYIVNMGSKEDVVELLNRVKQPYDVNGEYTVQLVADTSQELTGITTKIVKTEESQDIEGIITEIDQQELDREAVAAAAGVASETEEAGADEPLPESTGETDGLKDVSFVEEIEVAETYVSKDSVVSLEEAIAEVTKEKEENKVYEVVDGDCLSIVADKNGMTVARLLELNEGMSEDTVIQVGDELVVTQPEPELSVITKQEETYEENYEEPVQYVDNDSWYTTKEVVTQEAVTGQRKVTALVTYQNGKETGREIIAETVISPAVPKIIERGTQTPPTYIKPISGGTFTSGFKQRWGRMHKGVDWACPVGTAVKASSGGTVVGAGWVNGYGYCVTLRHPDGKQTRYAHLSKILVKYGQSVEQGEKIALSGNTGRSTGPHVHFEIIVNGSQVNPLNYL